MQQNFTKNSSLSHFHLSILESLEFLRDNYPERLQSAIILFPTLITRAVLHKFGWWVDPKNPAEFNLPKLKLFWDQLVNRKYITCSFEEFALHFIDDKKMPSRKIVWAGSIELLVLLFHTIMSKHKVIPQSNGFYALLCEHFEILDKKKNVIKPLKKESLPVNLSHANRDTKLENIVKDICYYLLS